MYWVRAGLLSGLKSLLSTYFTQDLDALGKQLSFDFNLLDEPDNRIPLDKALQVFDDCARITQCDHFGALLATHQSLDSLGMLAVLGEHAERFGEAVREVFGNMRLNATGVNWQIESDDNFSQLTMTINSQKPLLQGTLFGMTQAHLLFKSISNHQWRPLRVCFTCATPRHQSHWRQLLGDNLYFNMDFNGFIIDKAQLKLPIVNRNKRIMSIVSDYLKLTGLSQISDRIENIKMTIRTHLMLHQQCSLEEIAASQNTSPRAFQYYLKRHDLTYQRLLDDVRYQLAADYLTNSEHSVSTIASMVGFSDAAVFSRAFKKVYGVPPLKYRKAQSHH